MKAAPEVWIGRLGLPPELRQGGMIHQTGDRKECVPQEFHWYPSRKSLQPYTAAHSDQSFAATVSQKGLKGRIVEIQEPLGRKPVAAAEAG
jgi:hypothetical protein